MKQKISKCNPVACSEGQDLDKLAEQKLSEQQSHYSAQGTWRILCKAV